MIIMASTEMDMSEDLSFKAFLLQQPGDLVADLRKTTYQEVWRSVKSNKRVYKLYNRKQQQKSLGKKAQKKVRGKKKQSELS